MNGWEEERREGFPCSSLQQLTYLLCSSPHSESCVGTRQAKIPFSAHERLSVRRYRWRNRGLDARILGIFSNYVSNTG